MAKIEVIKQHDIADCGACCLACIIKYYHGYVPLEKIREDSCTGKEGTSAYHLIKASYNYGFDALGVKVDNINDSNIYLPAIAHLNLKNGLNHFVVVYKITKDFIYLMDPAQGKKKMPVKDFLEVWSNVLILLTPRNTIIKFAQENNLGRIFLKLLKQNKSLLFFIIILSILFMAVTIIYPFYFQIAVSSLENRSDLNLLKFVIFFFFGLVLLKIILSYLKSYYLNFLSKNLDTVIYTSFFNHLFNLPLKFIESRQTGEIMSRVQELSEVKDLLSEIFTSIILNGILILGSVVVLYLLNAKLFFVLCLIVIIYGLIGLSFSHLIYDNLKLNIEVTSGFNATLIEHLDLATSIKNLNLTPIFLAKLEGKLIKMLKCHFNFNTFLNNLELLKTIIYELGLFIITTYGIVLIYKGHLNILSFVTFESLLIYLFDPVKELINLIPKINYLKASFNKLKEFINLNVEDQDTGLKRIDNNALKITNLSYSYNQINNILNNVNLIIKPQAKVFLKGASGSGKSTLCKLLVKYNEKYRGNIKLNEMDLRDYSLQAIRQNIIYVGQEEKLFSGTIEENIKAYRKIAEKDFLKVLKICKIEEIIKNKPQRLESFINPSFSNLSGGERQRIILARALLKKAKIIILDEALSEVNIAMEKEIIDNILKFYPYVTLIYVSHKDVDSKFNQIIDLGGQNV